MHGTKGLFDWLISALHEELGADFRVSVVDYPNDQPLTIEALVDRVQRAAPTEPYVLVAESFSGPVALLHAAQEAKQLQAVVLVATFASNPLPWWLRWVRLIICPVLFRRPAPLWLLRWWLTSDAQLAIATQQALRAVRPEVLAQRARLTLTLDVRSQLAEIGVPVLYLHGACDRLLRDRGLAQLRGVRQLSAITLEDGPHLLLQALPARCAREIRGFLLR